MKVACIKSIDSGFVAGKGSNTIYMSRLACTGTLGGIFTIVVHVTILILVVDLTNQSVTAAPSPQY